MKPIANLRHYLMLAFFMVLPGLAVDARTTDTSRTDGKVLEKGLPPIDQNTTKVFKTASFGLG